MDNNVHEECSSDSAGRNKRKRLEQILPEWIARERPARIHWLNDDRIMDMVRRRRICRYRELLLLLPRQWHRQRRVLGHHRRQPVLPLPHAPAPRQRHRYWRKIGRPRS